AVPGHRQLAAGGAGGVAVHGGRAGPSDAGDRQPRPDAVRRGRRFRAARRHRSRRPGTLRGRDAVIREARDDDWPRIWPIIHDVVTEQRTFPYDPAMTERDARRAWLPEPPARVVVAVDGDQVTGTANMYANRPGPGSHVASGSLMVAKEARGAGMGRAL